MQGRTRLPAFASTPGESQPRFNQFVSDRISKAIKVGTMFERASGCRFGRITPFEIAFGLFFLMARKLHKCFPPSPQ